MTMANMPIANMDQKMAFELSALYDAEARLLEGMQQMAQQAQDEQLRSSLQMHAGQTQQQIQNLEQVFTLLGQPATRVPCEAAAGLVTDAQMQIQQAGSAEIRDILIIAASNKAEHFEMACYRGMVMGAQMMGNDEVVQLLQQNLQQEEQMAQKGEQTAQLLLQQAMGSRMLGS